MMDASSPLLRTAGSEVSLGNFTHVRTDFNDSTDDAESLMNKQKGDRDPYNNEKERT